jgi:organic radical activating enzyme
MMRENNCRLVVFTGGEPMLQDVFRIAISIRYKWVKSAEPRSAQPIFQVETAGTVWPETTVIGAWNDLPAGMVLVCSPKTPKINPLVIDHCSHWKYIIRADGIARDDGLPNETTQPFKTDAPARQKLYRPERKTDTIWVQPCDEADEHKTKRNVLAATASALKFGYRLSIQLHKIAEVE